MNSSPTIHKIDEIESIVLPLELSNTNENQIFSLIYNIRDPEHPHTLAELSIVSPQNIIKFQLDNIIHWQINITPTIPHCSLASIIGLCIIYRMKKFCKLEFNSSFSVHIAPETHVNDRSITKQLLDKDRVRAAFENKHIMDIILSCI
ncbi:MIP18 family protein galla-2 [Cucumispora dikerogammari]|nr:MIP18 family protein galla-2 [Cucumispora dikerogammari]